MIDMTVQIGSLKLKNPVLTASGTFGYALEYSSLVDLNRLGGVVVKGLSLEPRPGNRPPRICETSAGMLNSIGLQNVGLKAFVEEKLPRLKEFETAIIVNILGESVDDYARLAEALGRQKGVAALELNVSCPNVKAGGLSFGLDVEATRSLTKAVKEACDVPVWVKLTPNLTDPSHIARAAQEGGAEAVSLINTLLGLAIDPKTRRPRLGGGLGGLSGPAIKPVALRMVWQAARAVDIPVIGLGGITSGLAAAEFIIAGAAAVQVGTANFVNPRASLDILEELERFCWEEGLKRVSELRGSLVMEAQVTPLGSAT